MPLRKRPSKTAPPAADHGRKADDAQKTNKASKRQRLADFFTRARRRKQEDGKAAPMPVPVANNDPQRKPARDSKMADSTNPVKSPASVEMQRSAVEKQKKKTTPEAEAPLPTPPPESRQEKEQKQAEEKEESKVEPLTEEHIHALFSGAPHFFIKHAGDRPIPATSYPWDEELTTRDVSDSVQLAQPAYSAATLHRHLPVLQQAGDQERKYQGYNLEVTETPTMLGAQGLEPGTVGFAYFLEMPQADSMVTDLQQSQTSNEYLEAMRNKELMHQKPERLGIRRVNMDMLHARLVEFGDLFELFHDSPERMTILNNQSSGELYANLFGKFLTPPGYDGSADDPTGVKVQIDTLLKILRLKGVWYDFSLVEWRIRLGQILWSDPEPEDEHGFQKLWTEREILLLQITLACELLLRLDAVTSMDIDDVKGQLHISPEDYQGFLKLKTRKTNWDLVLARRFLENILVVKDHDDSTPTTEEKPRGFMAMLSPSIATQTATSDVDDLVLLPRHQARQLSGLLHFAQTIQWPGMDLVLSELAKKLNVPEQTPASEQQSPYGRYIETSTPSSISIYGTPLQSPRANEQLDSYFGNLKRPVLHRDSSHLQISLSTTLLAQADDPDHALNVGGWLSRSYLTGLVLPGEAISHFLMSTLLENDKLAVTALGDAANLYGGFIYSGRTWWSKASIVARVVGCVEGAVECMGWVSFCKLPENQADGWFAISSERPSFEPQPRITSSEDVVMRDSAVIPGGFEKHSSVLPTHLTLPRDTAFPPIPSIEFLKWNLTSIGMDMSDNDTLSTETETLVASVTLSSLGRAHNYTFSLTNDVQFVTSWPCTPPASSPTPSATPPQIVKRSLTQPPLSRTSSKRSVHSSRNGSDRSSRYMGRRNSHGFEPLFSHPPDAAVVGPLRMYDDDGEVVSPTFPSPAMSPRVEDMNAHPLHISYRYKIVPATDVLDPNFIIPISKRAYASPVPSPDEEKKEEDAEMNTAEEGEEEEEQVSKTVLVLDARGSKDLEVLARAWCAEKGFHALVGSVGRTCLACCIREARGLGINVVVRV